MFPVAHSCLTLVANVMVEHTSIVINIQRNIMSLPSRERERKRVATRNEMHKQARHDAPQCACMEETASARLLEEETAPRVAGRQAGRQAGAGKLGRRTNSEQKVVQKKFRPRCAAAASAVSEIGKLTKRRTNNVTPRHDKLLRDMEGREESG